ncbi:MAG: TRAP transporter substrate-binding protein [Burkholderiales bacterium]|nr:TRAP transporter substrate-binding protein [Burkholderiales bacterium]
MLTGALLLAAAGQAAAQLTLKLNESLGPGSVEEVALKHFKKVVEEGSKGQLQIAIHLQDALGKPDAALEGLMTGTLDLYSGALEYYAQIVPEELNAISIPYLLKDNAALRKYLASPTFRKAEQRLLERGIRVLSTEYNAERGPYRVLVSSKPVHNVDDLKGLKIRMFPNDVYIRSWKNLGATPVQLAWTETYLGIRQGVVNAVTAPIALVNPMKFTEVAPYIIEIKEYPQTWPIMISEKTWKKLTPDQQQLLVRAANEAGKVYTQTTNERIAGDLAAMVANNKAQIIKVDTTSFRKKMEPFYDELVKEKLLSPEILATVKGL